MKRNWIVIAAVLLLAYSVQSWERPGFEVPQIHSDGFQVCLTYPPNALGHPVTIDHLIASAGIATVDLENLWNSPSPWDPWDPRSPLPDQPDPLPYPGGPDPDPYPTIKVGSSIKIGSFCCWGCSLGGKPAVCCGYCGDF